MQFPEIKDFPGVPWVQLTPPEKHPMYRYGGFRPGESVELPIGHVLRPGYGAFRKATILDIDSEVPMRDGIKLYTNVFRPADNTPQPALIAWSPYGKCSGDATALDYDVMGPHRMGIPYQSLSGYETFEGPNPADWVERGYCVVDPDARGALHSEGNMVSWGPQEAIDIYDLIEWCTKQSWCDGTAVMFGNSWLAIAQVNHASLCPHPALKSIAPWEGATDLYLDFVARGGAYDKDAPFGSMLGKMMSGYNKWEDIFGAGEAHPLNDEYWRSKRIDVEKINLPIYLTASYSTRLHSRGSFETFSKVASKSKWLRVHDSQEWTDLYKEENMDELQKFYDYFAKGKKDNGWLSTPTLRLSLIGMDEGVSRTVVQRPENDTTFPLTRTRNEKFFFDCSNMTLGNSAPAAQHKATYEGHSTTDSISFTMSFDRYTELSGLPWAKLFVSCDSGADLDLHILIRKHGVSGKLLEHANYNMPIPIHKVPDANIPKFQGCNGVMRASHQASLLPKAHPDDFPVLAHDKAEEIEPGTVVPVEIPIWPIGMTFAAGEGVTVVIAGHDLKLVEVLPPTPTQVPCADDEDKVVHTIHSGGQTASFLMLPFITD